MILPKVMTDHPQSPAVFHLGPKQQISVTARFGEYGSPGKWRVRPTEFLRDRLSPDVGHDRIDELLIELFIICRCVIPAKPLLLPHLAAGDPRGLRTDRTSGLIALLHGLYSIQECQGAMLAPASVASR
jgi:hypothetical protein